MAASKIQIVEDEESTTFIEQEKRAPEIDKEALKALLFRKPPEPEVATEEIYVRCNRSTGKWVQCNREGRPIREFDAAVVVNATLSSVYHAYGCGGEYTGFACGTRLTIGTPISVPSKLISKLKFDNDGGGFRDANTGRLVEECDYLVLEAGCKHHYIKGKKK